MNAQRRIAIMGGSFNPVHIGHIIIADYLRQRYGFDQVWLMLSPLNPLKASATDLASDADRLAMLNIACKNAPGILPCELELEMPRPSYTVDTLARLRELHPNDKFTLVIGGDNWQNFGRWRSYDEIMAHYPILVYPRPGATDAPTIDTAGADVTIAQTPMLDISSTFIRQSVKAGLDMNFFLPDGVFEYIKLHQLYK